MLKLTLVTPARKFLTDAEVEELFVPAFKGELNILPGHAPLLSTLNTGVLKYRLAGQKETQFVAISWGYLEVTGPYVTVLAETAEPAAEIDLKRALAAQEKSRAAMFEKDIDMARFRKYQLKLQRATVRIQLGEKMGSPRTTH